MQSPLRMRRKCPRTRDTNFVHWLSYFFFLSSFQREQYFYLRQVTAVSKCIIDQDTSRQSYVQRVKKKKKRERRGKKKKESEWVFCVQQVRASVIWNQAVWERNSQCLPRSLSLMVQHFLCRLCRSVRSNWASLFGMQLKRGPSKRVICTIMCNVFSSCIDRDRAAAAAAIQVHSYSFSFTQIEWPVEETVDSVTLHGWVKGSILLSAFSLVYSLVFTDSRLGEWRGHSSILKGVNCSSLRSHRVGHIRPTKKEKERESKLLVFVVTSQVHSAPGFFLHLFRHLCLTRLRQWLYRSISFFSLFLFQCLKEASCICRRERVCVHSFALKHVTVDCCRWQANQEWATSTESFVSFCSLFHLTEHLCMTWILRRHCMHVSCDP